MRRIIRGTVSLLLGGILAPSAPGCGRSQADLDGISVVQSSMEEAALGEVGILYRMHISESKRPPKGLRDFQKNGMGYAIGYDWLSRGDLVALWGANLSDDASGTVLAHEKKVPEQGGYVLMQDGKTIKKMTAEEFKSAPKAGATAPAKAP